MGINVGKDTKIWHPELSNIYGDGYIGDFCNIGAMVEIRSPQIGHRCKIQAFVFIPEGVVIGNNVFIGPHVCFTNDKYPKAVGEWELKTTIIEDNVSIGANSTILPGVVIGKGALIGAGSVVTKDVDPYTIVAGNPAKVIGNFKNED